MSSEQATCFAGAWPGNCPPVKCDGCPRTFIFPERVESLEALRKFLGPESIDENGHCHYCGGDMRTESKLEELGYSEDEINEISFGHRAGCPVKDAVEILERAEAAGYKRP